MKNSILLCFSFFLLACSPIAPIQNRLEGLWIIEKITNPMTNENERFNIGVNSFFLDEDKACDMPSYKFSSNWVTFPMKSYQWNCKIRGVDTILLIETKCKCSYFDGEYIIHFTRDANRGGMSILEMRSDKLVIISSKDQFGVSEKWK